ncbi:MAG TPA: lipid-A-disaccharide synthase-related protein [Candidatus Rubrimentiphilum sp.]|nr:lipid-A-disaccharide synthase-related protein [Candidatus Rubrimentiphilum sp.]
MNVLFVSNGHGETAIAARIASQLRQLMPAIRCDHLALVGDAWQLDSLQEVGPRRAMPSGGLIAMGNLGNIARDLGAGLAGLTIAQWRFLRSVRGEYSVIVAVGDVLALVMALQARARATVFVGTAKSVHVASYGRFERSIIRKAQAVFVRDAATAQDLQSSGIAAVPANVIADLGDRGKAAQLPGNGATQLAIFPGSRDSAYEDARFLLAVVRRVAQDDPNVRAVLSIAPALQAERFAELLRADGWRVERRDDPHVPFAAFDDGRELVTTWTGPGEAMLSAAQLVLGQAGTANEAAAAAGIPVIAFVPSRERKKWYRRRQAQLLGDALLIVPRDVVEGARAAGDLLRDPQRRKEMAQAGRERMGPPGAARTIAERIVQLCA